MKNFVKLPDTGAVIGEASTSTQEFPTGLLSQRGRRSAAATWEKSGQNLGMALIAANSMPLRFPWRRRCDYHGRGQTNTAMGSKKTTMP